MSWRTNVSGPGLEKSHLVKEKWRDGDEFVITTKCGRTFTNPVDVDPSDLQVRTWRYDPTKVRGYDTYGDPDPEDRCDDCPWDEIVTVTDPYEYSSDQ